MAAHDVADSPPADDDTYNESEDEDFDPDAAAADGDADGDASSDEEVEEESAATGRKPAKGKRQRAKKADEEAEDIGFENSGDETVVKKGAKRRKKQGEPDGDESGGEGGFVKTRRMRAAAAEEQSRRPLATTAGATIDVDAVWAEMNNPKAQAAPSRPPMSQEPGEVEAQADAKAAQPSQEVLEDLIEIEETYNFAGESHTEKKLVSRSSVEGQKWLKTHPQAATSSETTDDQLAAKQRIKRHPDTGEPLLRPFRRISLWDPNPSGTVKGLPTNILSESAAGNKLRVVDKSKLGWHTEKSAPQAAKATKLNVVEKSKMDWQAHVDAAGDKEDLEKAAKAKGSYLERRDFLERVEARKDEEERRIRVK